MLFHVLGVWEKSKPSGIVLRTDFQQLALWSNKFKQLIKAQTYDTEGIAFDFMYPFFFFLHPTPIFGRYAAKGQKNGPSVVMVM